MAGPHRFMEILPHVGMLKQEEKRDFILCKPRLMPLKSFTLDKLDKMQKEAQERVKAEEKAEHEAFLDELAARSSNPTSSSDHIEIDREDDYEKLTKEYYGGL